MSPGMVQSLGAGRADGVAARCADGMAARSFGLLAKQKGALSPRELRSGHPRKESLNDPQVSIILSVGRGAKMVYSYFLISFSFLFLFGDEECRRLSWQMTANKSNFLTEKKKKRRGKGCR